MGGGGEDHGHGGPPPSLFSGLYEEVRETAVGDFFGFKQADAARPHSGQFMFEGMCFSILLTIAISTLVILSTKNYQRVPGKFRNLLEVCVLKLRDMIRMLMGHSGDRYLPYLGSLFIFILLLNLLGLIPLFRSPTLSLSITAGLGIVTFFVVQYCGIKANGPLGYVKHFMGPVWVLAPLMLFVELIAEIVKPVSLSLRLAGNIRGEDTLIEQLLHMGADHFIPLHLPILFFAVFTSFLQAFIFTALTAIYIQVMTSHGDDH